VTYISRRERALHPPSHPRGKLKELKDERARTRARERERERERPETEVYGSGERLCGCARFDSPLPRPAVSPRMQLRIRRSARFPTTLPQIFRASPSPKRDERCAHKEERRGKGEEDEMKVARNTGRLTKERDIRAGEVHAPTVSPTADVSFRSIPFYAFSSFSPLRGDKEGVSIRWARSINITTSYRINCHSKWTSRREISTNRSSFHIDASYERIFFFFPLPLLSLPPFSLSLSLSLSLFVERD